MDSKLIGSRVDRSSISTPERKTGFAIACAAIFLLACAVRGFHWQDNPTPPFHGMTGEYKAHAMVLVQGDLSTFLKGPNPPSNAHVIKHPPGYPLLMAAVYSLMGDSDGSLRLLHIVLDALCAVLVYLLAYELFGFRVALVAGLLVALSPQLAYHSVALLPDPLAAPPLLLAAWFLARAYKKPRLINLFACGLMIGVSCLFRSNTLLLPLFLCAALPILFARGLRLRFAAALLIGFLLLVVPVTIRNAIYFRAFVPLSLSAGITLVEGIGAYDKEKRFGLPDNDYLVSKWEAQEFGRPDYLGDRFGVDGVMRERYRVKRGLQVIASHPFWFAKVMLERASSMLRLARVELVRSQPAVRHSLSISSEAVPAWTISPALVLGDFQNNPQLARTRDGQGLAVSNYSKELFVSNPLPVKPVTDYLLRVPLKVTKGGTAIEVVDARQNKILGYTPILHPVNWLDLKPDEQPALTVDVSFVNDNADEIRVRLKPEAKSVVDLEVGPMQMFELGPASETWTSYPRAGLRLSQKIFITAVMLPFTLLGIVVLARRRSWPELAILLVLPIYYMSVQSALWTEFRYILSMHYFLFILAAVGFVWIGEFLFHSKIPVSDASLKKRIQV